ncbi:peptidylprolyl isomerase [Paenibacillus sp. MWE-103]|uniref:Peptidylprolyl isomerase n=1 Tax=Paenibacillus artemisiicola TaxID=1172618 RepID=A0ABS3WK43_9BACL|nr:peptidylprolyl isomerase [Paenibacillus artemisiicola]MBO7748642.1 peptidylprolyl isomerase [Paenibacillus artemisiicola]
MKKDRVLQVIVLLQALCLIVMALLVVYRVLLPPKSEPQVPPGGAQGHKDAPAIEPDPVVARVGDEQITEKELNGRLNAQYGDAVLRTLMVQAAIRLEAKAYGLNVTDGEVDDELARMMTGYDGPEAYYDAMKEQLGLSPDEIREDARYRLLLEKIAVRTADVGDDEVEAYIADNPQEFAPHTQLRIAWILSKTEKDADGVIQRLEDGEDFELMAKTYSVDADTAQDGGDLGYIDADDPLADPAMLAAAKELSVGETTGPVKVRDGFAVLRLTEKQTDAQMDPEKSRDQARKEIAMAKLNGQQAIEDGLLAKYHAAVLP